MAGDNIDYFVHCLPRIHELIGTGGTIAVSDREKYLRHINGTEIALPVESGDAVKEGGIAAAAMKEGRRMVRRVGSEVLGVPYIGLGIPLKDEGGQTIGTLIVAQPVTLQEEINGLVGEMTGFIGDLEKTTSGMAASSQELTAAIASLEQSAEGIKAKMKVVDSILGLIKEISDQTHLLGLNAAIEAARAGDQGRGFNVVAGEIRKLAGRTRDSLDQINREISVVVDSVEEVAGSVGQIASASEDQASAAAEINESISGLRGKSERILTLAEKLVTV